MTQSFCDPQPLAKFRLHAGEHGKGDYSDHTAYESMLELSSRGWVYQQRPGSKQLPSYKKGGHKVWYYCKHICRQYLQVLLLSESLFAAGLQEICHFQATAYYRTLIFFAATPIASEQRQAQTNVELLQTSSATSFRKISKTERESAGIGIWRLAVGQESGLSILSQIVCAIFNLTIIQHSGGFSIKMLVVR